MNILFFTTSIEHTTFRKTALMLKEEGARVHIIGFTRNNFPQGENKGLSVESLGVLSHGNYLSRMVKLIKFLSILRKRAKDFDVIYNFTLDTLIMSRLALVFTKKKWVYQIQDIRTIYFGKSIKSRLARWLEKIFIKKINILVVSSDKYFTDYYKDLYDVPANKVVVIENKLVKGTIHNIPNNENETIVFGYFGVMRCKKSWEILKKFAISKVDGFKVYLRGKPAVIPNIEEELAHIPNISFGGMYKSPDDLNDLYNKVDIVWACYPYSENRSFGNWKLARTIRYYEACAFGKPVIVQKGTPQAFDVEKYNIGLVIDMQNAEECIATLQAVTQEKLKIWHENLLKLDESFYYHMEEYKYLLEKIEGN